MEKMDQVFGISPVQRETITQQFDIIRVSFNEQGISGVSEHLEELNAIYSASKGDVLEIRVSGCPGGSADTIMTIISALVACPAHTVCILSGTNSSAATMIPLVCSEVITTPYTAMMCHSVSGGNFGTMANQERSAIFFSKLYSEFMEDIYEGFLFEEELDDLKKGLEIYLDANEIQERLEYRQALMEDECIEECDDTCSSTENPCKECYELPKIGLPVDEELPEEGVEEVTEELPTPKRAVKPKK